MARRAAEGVITLSYTSITFREEYPLTTSCPPSFAIWLYGPPDARRRAACLKKALTPDTAPVFLGPPGKPAPDLDLGAEPDLGLALESCPDGLRPKALVLLDGDRPPSADELPCPALHWDNGAKPEDFAREVMVAARRGESFPWLERVQVNLPLTGLLGRYGKLAVDWPVNPEVGIDAHALDTLGPKDLALAKELLAGRLVSVHLPFMDLNPGVGDPRVAKVVRERLEKAATWAVELGAVQAVAHLSYDWRMYRDMELFVQRLKGNLGPTVEVLKQAGAVLALENTFEHMPDVLVIARHALSEAYGTRVGFCLDPGHTLAFSHTSLEEWWRAFAPHLIELHLHDNDGSFDDHLPPGRGNMDWGFIKDGLAKLEQEVLITLEPHREAHFWASLRGLERVWG